LDEVTRQDGDAFALARQRGHAGDGSQPAHRREAPHLAGRSRVEEVPEEGQVRVRVEQGVPRRVLVAAHRLPRQQRGRRHQRVLLLVQAGCLQAGLRQACTGDDGVHQAAVERGQGGVGVPEVEVQPALRARRFQLAQRGQDPGEAELEARPQHQVVRGRRIGTGHQAAARFLDGQLGVRQRALPGLAHPAGAGVAHEELLAEQLLEPLDAIAEGRRGEGDLARGAAEALVPRGGDEAAERIDVRELHGRARPA
jgi:hypothetical protein